MYKKRTKWFLYNLIGGPSVSDDNYLFFNSNRKYTLKCITYM